MLWSKAYLPAGRCVVNLVKTTKAYVWQALLQHVEEQGLPTCKQVSGQA
jgi:hypothetical protein